MCAGQACLLGTCRRHEVNMSRGLLVQEDEDTWSRPAAGASQTSADLQMCEPRRNDNVCEPLSFRVVC